MVKVIAKGMGVTPGRAVSPLLWEKARRKGYGRSKNPFLLPFKKILMRRTGASRF